MGSENNVQTCQSGVEIILLPIATQKQSENVKITTPTRIEWKEILFQERKREKSEAGRESERRERVRGERERDRESVCVREGVLCSLAKINLRIKMR